MAASCVGWESKNPAPNGPIPWVSYSDCLTILLPQDQIADIFDITLVLPNMVCLQHGVKAEVVVADNQLFSDNSSLRESSDNI